MGVSEVFAILSVVLLFGTLAAAAVTDVLHRKIYNTVTYPAIALGLALAFGVGGPGQTFQGPGLLGHFSGFLLGFALLFVAWWARAVGGGEVKLAAAIGAIGGLQFVVGALFWSSLVGAIMAMWALVWYGKLGQGLRNSLLYAAALRPERVIDPADPAAIKIPYAVAIAFGTFLTWFLQQTAHPVI